MTTDPHRLISKACPHCKGWDLNVVELVVLPAGDEPRSYISDFFVGCGFCGSLGPPSKNEFEAVEQWNDREPQRRKESCRKKERRRHSAGRR